MSAGANRWEWAALSLEWGAAASQLLTLLCWLKGNGAWQGGLSLLFLGLAGACWCRFAGDQAVSRFLLGVLWCLLGAALLLKFSVSP